MKPKICKLILILLLTPFLYAGNSELPWIQLTLRPSTEAKTDSQLSLMPKETELTEGDAVPIYQNAIKSFPKDFSQQKFIDWRKLPNELDQLPITEIESELDKLKPTIDLLNKAARSKQCNWPVIKPEQVQQQLMGDLEIFKQFSYILDVQTKLRIVQGKYDLALDTLKTNIKMASQLGGAPALIQTLIGIASAEMSLDRIQQLVQSENSPNLNQALKSLPRPLTDINKAIKVEIDNLDNYNFLVRSQFRKTLEPAQDRVRKQMNHVERRIAALQIIEALRNYAGKHDGKLPEKLSDITDIKIPNDPVTKKTFEYKSTDSGATIQIEGTEGSNGRDSVRYEIKMKQ